MLSKAVIAISALAVLAACGAVSVPKPSVVADGVVSVASFRSEGNPPFEPVGGDIWPVAIYWCFVGLGTPAVQFPVAIDSGSYTLDIPKIGCQGCVHQKPNAAYDPTASSTSSNLNQPFSNSYETCDLKDPTAVCTITGHWYSDVVTLAGKGGNVTVSFGAIETQTTNFDQFKHIDGVMGMAGSDGQTNVFSQLVQAGAFAKDEWAICMHHGSKSNGTITFGGTDSRLYHGELEYVDNPYGSQFYGVATPMMSIDFLNGTSAVIENTQSNSILDTGTNVLLLPTDPYNSVISIFQSSCGSGKELHGVCSQPSILDGKTCLPFTQEQIDAFPGVSIQLSETLTLHMTGKDIILRHPTDNGLYCFGIRVSSSGGYQIIGDTTMRNYVMAMDRENNQVGWAPVNTDNCGSI